MERPYLAMGVQAPPYLFIYLFNCTCMCISKPASQCDGVPWGWQTTDWFWSSNACMHIEVMGIMCYWKLLESAPCRSRHQLPGAFTTVPVLPECGCTLETRTISSTCFFSSSQRMHCLVTKFSAIFDPTQIQTKPQPPLQLKYCAGTVLSAHSMPFDSADWDCCSWCS